MQVGCYAYRVLFCVGAKSGFISVVHHYLHNTASCVSTMLLVRPSVRGTVHSRPHKIFLHFHDLSTILNKIREGVALSPLSILHKSH